MYGLPIYGKTNSYGSTKRIKNYSYNPLDSIGKGFSSVVYKGVNDQNKELVAIKAIDMKGIRDSAAKQMLQFEIQALTTLNHPNIMKCFDVVKETSHCYVITQLCNGGDLGEMLKKKGRFNEAEASKILKDIVKAYVQIANKGFLHRDLKLANVLMNNGQAKIADFGFAKKCRAQSIKQRYNVGSPLYMSPQALKNNIYSVKNDIWSIGIMAFEMLHGDTPWQCKTEKQLIDKMVRIPVKFRDSLKISNDLKDFIRKCLQVNQSKRMSVEDLKNWLTEQQQYNEQVHNIQNIPTQQPRLTQKTTTFQKLTSRPLSQLTNKVVSNSNNSKSVNKLKSNINLTEFEAKGKEKQRNKDQLSKSVVNFNNNLIIKEIILFRLHFKALQKLKQTSQLPSPPAQLKNILGNQTIRRVTLLKKLICSEQLGINHHYSLKNVQNYLNPIYNPDIKKYKSVVNEYFNKYTSQIKMQILQGKTSPSQIISAYLKGISGSQIQKQSLLLHWLVNLTKASTSLSKGELEQILEPKNQINPMNLRQRIQQICV